MPETLETATLAGGCFWCTEAIFKRLRGVSSVTPGYAGGTVPDPTYIEVSSGATGYAESVHVLFDPSVIPFAALLDVFFHTHDPTSADRQGNDIGTQYRSAVFYHTDEQRRTASGMVDEFDRSNEFGGKVVTQIVPFTTFYPAETYHRDYYDANPTAAYCSLVISPKLSHLMERYAHMVHSP